MDTEERLNEEGHTDDSEESEEHQGGIGVKAFQRCPEDFECEHCGRHVLGDGYTSEGLHHTGCELPDL